jgi:hypothetical protein
MIRSAQIHERKLGALVLALCVASSGVVPAAFAEEMIGGTTGDWLSRYAGARSVGMGGAYVAMPHDALGMLWNPAGMQHLYQNEVHLETVRLFEDTSVNSLGFVIPGSRLPSFGFAMLALRSGEFEKTTELNESLGNFENSETAFLLSASKNLGRRFALGTTVKVLRQTVEDFDAGGVGLDLGMLFDVSPTVRLGASLLSIGGPNLTLREQQESMPFELRGGLALRLLGGRGVVSAEVDHRSDFDTSLHAGTEFWVHPSMALRLGYYDASAAGGFSYKLQSGWRFDYGVSDHELGITHRLGVSVRFGGFFARSQAVPEVFSPTGQQSVTRFQLKSRTKAEAAEWSMEIYDKSEEVVRRFGGQGVPPPHITWDGKDEAGLPLADGTYRYQLAVVDDEGRVVESREESVEISTAGPQGSVPVIIE